MWLNNLKTYRKFLSNNKLYTLVTIFGFAVALMFVLLLSIYVKQELSVDKFHKNKDRIFLMAKSDTHAYFANPVAEMVKENIPEVESFTRLMSSNMTMKMNDKEITAKVLFADTDFFHIFSFDLLDGQNSAVLKNRNSAVISKSFANKLFPNENPVGKTIPLGSLGGFGEPATGNNSLTITGIMENLPINTQIPEAELVIQYEAINEYVPGLTTQWWNIGFAIYLLAKENTDLTPKAATIVDLFYKNDYSDYTWDNWKELYFIPLTDVYFRRIETASSQIRTNSKTLITTYITITILILIVSILNYISLSVSQTGKRGKEAAIKKLLGSGRKQLITQFVSESMIMTVLSFFIAIFLAFLCQPFFNDLLNTRLGLKNELLSFPYNIVSILSILVIGLIAGLIPAITISRFKPIEAIKGTYVRKSKTVYAKISIVFQYTVAISLLICSSFIILQTNYMKNYNMGFETDNIFLLQNTIETSRENSLRSQFEAIPGVEKVSFSQGVPLTGGWNQTFQHNGQTLSFQEFQVDSAFFDIFKIEIKSSTGIQPSDIAIWVNQKGYNALNIDPDTHMFEFREGIYRQIAGVTNNFNFSPLRFETGMTMIRYRNQHSTPDIIAVKISKGADLVKTANEIKEVYSEINGGKSFESFFSDEIIELWYQWEEKTARLLTTFTILTLIILLMGILALSLYYVQQKGREIGIRKVNGATEMQIIKLLNMNFIGSILIAFPIASAIAYYASQKWLQTFAYKISLSWWVFTSAGIVAVAVSAIFITLQSWKAATANPVVSLKTE